MNLMQPFLFSCPCLLTKYFLLFGKSLCSPTYYVQTQMRHESRQKL